MEDETTKLNKYESSLNSKRTLFNVIVFIILPTSLILTFIYSLILTRENKVDYLLFIVTITITYTFVMILINLLKNDTDLTGLKYVMNKLNIDNDVDANINLVINNDENICEVNFNYPDKDNASNSIYDVDIKTSKIIGGETITNEKKKGIKNDTDKKFYDRCDSLSNKDNLFKNIGICIGKDSDSINKCSERIKDAEDSDDANDKCELWESSKYYSIIISVLLILVVIGFEIKDYITGSSSQLWTNSFIGTYLFYNFISYLYRPQCDYVDINYSDISVSPLSKRLIYTLFFIILIKGLSQLFYIIMGFSKSFTSLLVYLVMLSGLYIIKDYSFISILEDNYSGFGKFINILKLDRKNDSINYDFSFRERDTDKRCLISGVWDKNNTPANIKGDLTDCNIENLGKFLGTEM